MRKETIEKKKQRKNERAIVSRRKRANFQEEKLEVRRKLRKRRN